MKMSHRNNQKQIWTDEAFKKTLEKIMAARQLNGNPVKNIGQLTREMLQCSSFKALVQELIKKDKKDFLAEIRVKIDNPRLFG